METPPRQKQQLMNNLLDCLDLEREAKEPIIEKLVQRPEPVYWRTATCKTLHNVLSPNECQSIIQRAESIGFEQALLNVGGGRQILATESRNSDRCIVDDKAFAQEVFRRVWKYIPQTVRDSDGTTLKATCLNERMRILRYKKGHYFRKHSDGQYDREDGSETSRMTVMIYLNGDYTGGHTLVFSDSGDEEKSIIAEPGLVFIFRHELAHESPKLESGVKYAIRTDLMYAKAD